MTFCDNLLKSFSENQTINKNVIFYYFYVFKLFSLFSIEFCIKNTPVSVYLLNFPIEGTISANFIKGL